MYFAAAVAQPQGSQSWAELHTSSTKQSWPGKPSLALEVPSWRPRCAPAATPPARARIRGMPPPSSLLVTRSCFFWQCLWEHRPGLDKFINRCNKWGITWCSPVHSLWLNGLCCALERGRQQNPFINKMFGKGALWPWGGKQFHGWNCLKTLTENLLPSPYNRL